MVYGVSHFRDLVAHLTGEQPLLPYIPQKQYKKQHNQPSIYDFSYIKGQTSAKRALEIAAAGNHNIILQGPPGSGKTLLAKTLPSIMPPLSEQEAIEVTTIYSIAGLLDTESGLLKDPPFRTPHHTASSTSLVGGGSIPRPGEISLSHRGILFLDEFPEFPKKVIEQLRQPLEDGTITVTRASGNATFPAEFLCIASMNPCPCGFASDPERACQCSQFQIQSYQKKLSGPILDRFDLFVEAPRVDIQALQNTQDCPEPSDTVRKRVSIARKKQLERAAETTCFTNSELSQRGIQQFCTLEKEAETLLGQANEQLQLSARAYFRCIKVARTIADLAESKDIKTEHILEALRFRRITS
jgi:magnesium chelatase family protein